MLASATSIPLADKILLDREEALDLIDQIRAAIPEDVQHAQEVLETRDRILQEARDGAERLRMEAEALFRQRLDEHEITAAARNEGRDIVARSQQQAQAQLGQAQAEINQRRQELEEYSMALLRRLEANLSSQLETVRGGISGMLEEKSRLQPPQ